jgi:hypothetical protein
MFLTPSNQHNHINYVFSLVGTVKLTRDIHKYLRLTLTHVHASTSKGSFSIAALLRMMYGSARGSFYRLLSQSRTMQTGRTSQMFQSGNCWFFKVLREECFRGCSAGEPERCPVQAVCKMDKYVLSYCQIRQIGTTPRGVVIDHVLNGKQEIYKQLCQKNRIY